MIRYRKAGPGDEAALAQMRVDTLCEETDYPEEFLELLRNNTLRYIAEGFANGTFSVWTATHGGEMVAMGGLTFYALPPNDWCPGGKTAYLCNMYTKPAYRRQGIAAKLLSLLVEEAVHKGCERILLYASDKGRPMYVKYGFEASPDAMAYYPNGKAYLAEMQKEKGNRP